MVNSGASSIASVLLVVLLGASPLIGPLCAMLCGHSSATAGHVHDAAAEHDPHAHHQPPAVEHAARDHGDPHVALWPGVTCCTFEMAPAEAALRSHTHVVPTHVDASPPGAVATHHGRAPSAVRPPTPPRPDFSSGRPPLVLRI